MLDSIRTYFFEKEKSRRLKQLPGKNFAFHPGRKNHYGLLFDASSPDDRNTALSLAEELRMEGNRVKVLGFVEGRMEGLSLSFDVFTSAELSRLSGIPKNVLAQNFMEQPFDVLINLSIYKNHKPLEYISSVSKASFTVGPWYPQEHNVYDLCIDVERGMNLKRWIGEVMHTLQKIY